MKTDWGLRCLAIWLLAVLVSLVVGVGSAIANYPTLSEICGMILITMIGGVVVAAGLAAVVSLWAASSEGG